MVNPFVGNLKTDRKGKEAGKPQRRKGAKAAKAPEKPAFPNAGVPGKTQSRDRSQGVRRAKQHPKSVGL